jgi:hypothetical protein
MGTCVVELEVGKLRNQLEIWAFRAFDFVSRLPNRQIAKRHSVKVSGHTRE